MADPARNNYDGEEESEARYLSAQERANQRWGMGEESETEEPDSSEDSSLPSIDRPNLRVLEGGGESTPRRGFYRGGDGPGNSPNSGKGKDESSGPSLGSGDTTNGPANGPGGKASSGLEKAARERAVLAAAVGGGLILKGLQKIKDNRGKSIVGFLIGLMMIVFGLGVFMLSTAQPIHLAQILAKNEFGNEQTSHVRLNALYRYAKTGNYGEVRLGWAGSRAFAPTQEQLAKIGVSFEQYKTFGNAKAITIEIDKNPATVGLSREEAKAALAELYQKQGINISETDFKNVSGTKVAVFRKDIGMSATRQLARSSVDQLDNGKIVTFMQKRLVARFLNLPSGLHPLSKAKAAAEAKADAKLDAKARKQAQEEAEKARVKETLEANKPTVEAEKAKLSGKLTGVKAGAATALLITGVVCVIRNAADDAIAYNRVAVVEPQIANSIDKQAVGSQQQSGQDFVASQIGAVNATFSDPDGKTIWQGAALAATVNPNGPATGEDLPAAYGQAFRSDTTAKTLGSLGGAPMDYACSRVGQIVQGIAGVAAIVFAFPTGGGTTAAYAAARTAGSVAVGMVAMKGIHDLIKNALTDDMIEGKVSAPIRGDLLAYGSRELANTNARAAGGVMLSASESLALDRQQQADSAREFAKKPLLARLFDTSDYRSATSRVIDQQSPSARQNLQNIASSLLRMPSILGSLFASMLPKAQAAGAPYDFGFSRAGIPARVLNNPDYDDPYTNGDIVAATLDKQDGTSQHYIDKAMKCFGSDISKGVHGWMAVPKTEVNPSSRDYEDADCAQADDPMWDRMMLFVHDNADLDGATCFLGDGDVSDTTQACQDLGVSSGSDVAAATTSAGAGGQYKVGTFNLRGQSHVSGASASSRMKTAADQIKANGYDVVGLQELQGVCHVQHQPQHPPTEQRDVLYANIKDTYSMFPGCETGDNNHSTENSIIWNTSKFKMIDSGTSAGQYFTGSPLAIPYVELQDTTTGQTFYVSNTHDPADTHGQSAKSREADVAVHLSDAGKWVSAGVPVIMTGDFNWGYNIRKGGPTSDYYYIGGNDARLPYCLITKDSVLFDAKDGKTGYCPSNTKQINGPGARTVDHILASSDLTATNYSVFTNAAINSVTDHPGIVTATIGMPGSGSTTGTTTTTTTTGSNPSTPQTINGVKNFRDAAALTNTLSPGVLFRSGELSGITVGGTQQLSDILGNTGTIIDLRTPDQRKNNPDPIVPGAKEVQVPIEGILQQAPMVTDSARRAQIAKALRTAEKAPGVVLFHCSDGKDRTGWLVAMIMYNAGSSDADVMSEYMQSSVDFPGPSGVEPQYLQSGLDAIKSNYGSVHGYLTKGLGLSTADLAKLNQKFGIGTNGE